MNMHDKVITIITQLRLLRNACAPAYAGLRRGCCVASIMHKTTRLCTSLVRASTSPLLKPSPSLLAATLSSLNLAPLLVSNSPFHSSSTLLCPFAYLQPAPPFQGLLPITINHLYCLISSFKPKEMQTLQQQSPPAQRGYGFSGDLERAVQAP